MSETARDFVKDCLTIDPTSRPTAAEALQHPWLASDKPHFVPDPESPSGRPTDLLPNIQKAFDAKKTCTSRSAHVRLTFADWLPCVAVRKAVFSMIATKRLSTLAGFSPNAQALGANIQQFKEESEKEQVDEVRVLPSAAGVRRRGRGLTRAWGQDRNVMHYGGNSEDSKDSDELKKEDDVSKSEAEGHIPLVHQLEKMSM